MFLLVPTTNDEKTYFSLSQQQIMKTCFCFSQQQMTKTCFSLSQQQMMKRHVFLCPSNKWWKDMFFFIPATNYENTCFCSSQQQMTKRHVFVRPSNKWRKDMFLFVAATNDEDMFLFVPATNRWVQSSCPGTADDAIVWAADCIAPVLHVASLTAPPTPPTGGGDCESRTSLQYIYIYTIHIYIIYRQLQQYLWYVTCYITQKLVSVMRGVSWILENKWNYLVWPYVPSPAK